MKSKKLLLLSFCMLLLCGCGKNADENAVSDIEKPNEVVTEQAVETIAEPDMLHFVDALGDWHDVEIKESWAKHSYNWEGLQNDGINVSYSNSDGYELVKGVDVSKYQGNVDWNVVKSEGYEFAIIRIAFRGYGEAGTLKVDEKFNEFFRGAKSAGLDVGVYVFSQAINEQEAVEEAQLVIDTLNGAQLELPVVFDPETIRNDEARTDDVTGEQFTANARAFFDKIKDAGYKPMIYCNMMWEAYMLDLQQLEDIPVWYADYEKIPQTPYAFEFWQYTEKGKVNGITGECDLNVWFRKNTAE